MKCVKHITHYKALILRTYSRTHTVKKYSLKNNQNAVQNSSEITHLFTLTRLLLVRYKISTLHQKPECLKFDSKFIKQIMMSTTNELLWCFMIVYFLYLTVFLFKFVLSND